jgi:hypothetical protein
MKRLSATILTNRFPVSGLVPGNVIIDNVIITWCMCLKNRRAKWRKREKALGNDVPSVFGTGGSNEMINSSFVGSSMFYNNSSTSAADFYHQHLHDSLWSTANGSMHPFLLLAGNSIAAAAAFGAATNTTWPSVPLQKVPTSTTSMIDLPSSTGIDQSKLIAATTVPDSDGRSTSRSDDESTSE